MKILWLTSGRSVRYAQKQDKRGSFSNVTTVLFLSSLVRGDMGAFRGQSNHPPTGLRSQDHRNGKTAA